MKRIRMLVAICLAAISFLALSTCDLASIRHLIDLAGGINIPPGTLDETFGNRGIASVDAGGPLYDFDMGLSAKAVAVQPDGKIVVSGTEEDRYFNPYTYDTSYPYLFANVRLNSDGTIDESDLVDLGDGIYSTSGGRAVALDSSGKIIVAGAGADLVGVLRYTTAFALDPTFSSDGKVTTAVGAEVDEGTAVAIQDDDKVVVAGRSNSGGAGRLAVVRYTTAGALDSSFDTDGMTTTTIGDASAFNGVAIQSDGKIIAAGYTYTGGLYDFAIVRYTTGGALDAGYGSGGIVTTDFGTSNDQARSIALQSDGKAVVAGYSGTDLVLARYTTDGTLDSSFGTSGKATLTDLDGLALAIQSDGKIVVAGESAGKMVLARFNGDGSIDSTFGTNGRVSTQDYAIATSVAIQADGKILATLQSSTSNSSMVVARFWP